MSRIYQGGQSQNSYQARSRQENYSPTQAISEAENHAKQGARKLRDLETLSRETDRKNQTANLERESADRAANIQLEIEQTKASQLLKQQQIVQNAELETAELVAGADLKMQQTTESGQVKIEQVKDKGVLELNQARESSSLKLQHMEEGNLLKSQHSAIRADNNLALQHLQYKHQAERNVTNQWTNAISQIISFAGTVNSQLDKQNAEAEKEEKAKVDAASYHHALTAAPISSTGEVNPSITQEAGIRAVEVAEGTAIAQVAPGDMATQEALKQPSADAAMMRSDNIGAVTSKALTFGPRLTDARNNPETLVYDKAGQLVPITSLRSVEEYQQGLYQIGQRLSAEDGISQASDYAVINAYGPKMREAFQSALSERAGQIETRNDAQRSTSTNNTATGLLNAGQGQAAWNHAWSGSHLNSSLDGKNNLERGKSVLNTLMSGTSNLDAVGKIRLPSGGTIEQHPTYGAMLADEKVKRFDRATKLDEMGSAQAQVQVDVLNREMETELIRGGADADVGAIKERYAQQFNALGTTEGMDKATALLKGDYRVSQALYQSYKRDFANNKPPTSSELVRDFTDGRLSKDMFLELKTLGEFGDDIDQRITASGVPKAEDMAKDIVSEATSVISRYAQGGAGSNVEQTNTLITNAIAPEIQQKLRAFASANPNASGRDFIIEGNRIQEELRGRLKPTDANNGELRWSPTTGFQYDGLSKKAQPVLTTKSADGSRTVHLYDNTNVQDLPSSARSTDLYFTEDEARVAGERYMAGTPNNSYSPRTRAIAKKLGMYPSAFVRRQLQNMGYTMSTDFNTTSAVQSGKAIDPGIMDGLNVIGKYESDSVGGYNAVNQVGMKGGRDTDGYSGHYSKLGGRDLTSMTLGEVMELQAPRPGMSNEQWKAEGRLHAVGRYQFIGDTLRGTAEAMGISPSEKFTPELQDRMGAWLLSEYGMGQWVGPSDRATPQERALVQTVRQKLRAARVILSNPNAGNIQRARAMRTVGRPFG